MLVKMQQVQQASAGEPLGHLVGQQVTAGGPPRRKNADRREKTIVLLRMLCQSEDKSDDRSHLYA